MSADARKFSYFPGCSLSSSAAEYHHSSKAVFGALGVELAELPDWTCCGASSAHSLSKELSVALPMRNLTIADGIGLDVVAPCASCFNRLKTAEMSVRRDDALRKRIGEAAGREFQGNVTTLNVLDLLTRQVGLDVVRERVIKKLAGLKIVCYYGCLLVRPPDKIGAANPDNPMELDDLMEALGAEPKFWAFKTDCCGAGHTIARGDIVERMTGRIVDMAREAGADAIVTACTMCHANIEMRQKDEGGRLPVFYFTELMGLAFGIDAARSWLGKHIISPLPLLRGLGLAP